MDDRNEDDDNKRDGETFRGCDDAGAQEHTPEGKLTDHPLVSNTTMLQWRP